MMDIAMIVTLLVSFALLKLFVRFCQVQIEPEKEVKKQ